MLHCHADGMISSLTRMYPLYSNNGDGRTNYGPIKKVSAGEDHVLCGCFRDARISENGENYKGYKVLAVAQNPARTVKTEFTLDPSVTSITVTQNNTTQVIPLSNLAAPTKVIDGDNGVALTYLNNVLTLDIPEGEALLIEF